MQNITDAPFLIGSQLTFQPFQRISLLFDLLSQIVREAVPGICSAYILRGQLLKDRNIRNGIFREIVP